MHDGACYWNGNNGNESQGLFSSMDRAYIENTYRGSMNMSPTYYYTSKYWSPNGALPGVTGIFSTNWSAGVRNHW